MKPERMVRQLFVEIKKNCGEKDGARGEGGVGERGERRVVPGGVGATLRRYGMEEWWEEGTWGDLPGREGWKKQAREAVRARVERDWLDRISARPSVALMARVHCALSPAQHLAAADGHRLRVAQLL